MSIKSQIQNRNFLSPTGFNFKIQKAPKVSFFCNEANIPDITLGISQQSTYLKDISIPGDKITFGDLSINFLVDENLENYMQIQNWIRSLGYPESLDQIRNFIKTGNLEDSDRSPNDLGGIYSDGVLQILNSNMLPTFQVFFKDLFPYSLSTLNFDTKDNEIAYFTSRVNFKYTIYEITDMNGNKL